MSEPKWIGVDLDGTLAHYIEGTGIDSIGPPVERMLRRVLDWLDKGADVRIYTARVAMSGLTNQQGVHDGYTLAKQQKALIEAWCQTHIGQVLPVTATKDFMMGTLYDDRCRQVERNTGRIISGEEEPNAS